LSPLPQRRDTGTRKESNVPEENLPQTQNVNFEALKRTNDYGAEYWSARDLQPLLGYNHWRSFESAVKKAIASCQQSGNDPSHHFARARNMITAGKGASREVKDYHLSRFACYLVVTSTIGIIPFRQRPPARSRPLSRLCRFSESAVHAATRYR
jgi:hypothetical protein